MVDDGCPSRGRVHFGKYTVASAPAAAVRCCRDAQSDSEPKCWSPYNCRDYHAWTWNEARDKCETLVTDDTEWGGYDDWRLCTMKEMRGKDPDENGTGMV